MKICNILLCLNPGGAENVAAKLSNIWIEQGHDVTIILFVNSKYPNFYDIDKRVKIINLDIFFNSKNLFSSIINNFKRILLIRKQLKIIKPNVIIAHCSREITLSFFSNLFLKNKLIGYIHSNPKNITKERSKIWKILTYLSFSFVSHCIVFSNNSKKYLPILARKKAISFLNLFTENKENISPNYKIKNIVVVGSFIEVKNHIMLIKTFSKIQKVFKDWTLTIVGDGHLKKDYEKLLNIYNLKKKVFLPGVTKNIYSYYSNASIFVLSSISEGLNLSLLEASSFGLPCIISNCSESHKQIIEHNKNGYIYQNSSPQELYDYLFKLMNDQEQREKFGNYATQNSYKFSNLRTIKKWNNFLDNGS